MINYIGISIKNNLPKLEELVWYMWEKNISFSYYKNGKDLVDSTEISVSWDKWLDNSKWSSNIKAKEHIYIEIYNRNDTDLKMNPNIFHMFENENVNNIISVEIESDDVVTVDRRAFNRATYIIAKKCDGIIYDGQRNKLLGYEEFYNINKFIIEKAFDKSVEDVNRNNNLRIL